jgi:hypothetical protein
VPDCATWWFDHVGETYMYVLAVKNGDERLQRTAVEKLVDGAEKWGDLLDIPYAGKLMGDHVSAVKVLVDSAFLKDQEGIDLAVEGVLLNAKEQADLYGMEISGFPLDEFDKLFTTHITATGGYVLALSSGDISDFKKNYAMVIQNRNQLARFWGLLCMRKKTR